MGSKITRWSLEFLLRQPISDLLANKLLSNLRVYMTDDCPRVKRAVLLRAIDTEIGNGSISETILESLELLEEMDRKDGIVITESMKVAYCAVAVECTVKYLWASTHNRRSQGNYFKAVKRIWRERIGKMEELKTSHLLTEGLMKWRDDIEAAIWDTNVSNRLWQTNTRNDAIRLVGMYIGEAMALVGPSFLEEVVRTEKEAKRRKVEDKSGEGAATECNVDLELTVRDGVVNRETRVCDDAGEGTSGTLANASLGLEVAEGIQRKDKEIAKKVLKRKHVASRKRNAGPVRIADSGELDMDESSLSSPAVNKVEEAPKSSLVESQTALKDPVDMSSSKYDTLPSREVSKVQEALKSSSMALQAVVKDPLPDALDLARKISNQQHTLMENQNDASNPSVNTVISEIARKNGRDTDVPSPPTNQTFETLQTEECNDGVPSSSHQNAVPKPSLMEIARENGKDGDVPNPLINQTNGDAPSHTVEALQTEERNAGVISSSHQNDVPKPNLVEIARKNGNDGDGPNPPTNQTGEALQMNEHDSGVPSSSHQNDVPKPSLMERNNTARTFEWDDSVEGSDEGAANRFHLDSPKIKAVSPLKRYEVTKFARRRKIKRWSLEEEDALREGVQKFGRGNWKLILNSKRDIFAERTEVDLKDKWRNMTRY